MVNIFTRLNKALVKGLNKVAEECRGKPSNYTTFEKLVVCGEDEFIAAKVENACKVFRSRFHNDNVIVQCCAKGFVNAEDLNMINESHCGIVRQPALVRRIIFKRTLTWKEFVKCLRLEV